ncbi:Transcriptional activator NphR [Roseivivax jejudonensis]|uniref:Transcriptional activator NphR n=1 Tax=Roseivivax jejudonensis TaxID=1529041 RepID=A0A1X6ZSS7_9RHOB|nr:AraC family transcriptional regulator [Roseivivax jejudonensis]SLN60214.1 Transcriptional activator NphR [Roseivivax jejudonensis]
MGTVTEIFARTLVAAAGFRLDPDGRVRDGAAVVARVPARDGRVPDETYFDLIARVAEKHGDPVVLAIDYGKRLRIDDLGVLGLAMKSAPTLRAALERAARYFLLMTDTVAYRLQPEAGGGVFRIETLTRMHPALAVRNACALTGFATAMRQCAGSNIAFAEVTLRHDPGGPLPPLERFFGCPVRLGGGPDAIRFGPGVLDRETRLGDAAMSDYFAGELAAALDRHRTVDTITARVRVRLARSLSGGVPPAADMARALGLSERSLSRRLADERASYPALVRETRREMAERLLAEGDGTIAEVAFCTGFAEQSTFSRAFKSWTGQTPARFRQARRHA